MEKQTLVELKTILNLQNPDIDNSLTELPDQDKIKFRRERVNKLRIWGYSPKQIAIKIGYSLSTIEKDLQIIGSATLILEQKFIHDGKCVGHIEDVVINKKFQKLKFGSKLISKLIQRAHEEGCYKTVLDCLDDVAPFYKNLGFVPHLKGMRYNHTNSI